MKYEKRFLFWTIFIALAGATALAIDWWDHANVTSAADADTLLMLDVSDTSSNPNGKNVEITVANLLKSVDADDIDTLVSNTEFGYLDGVTSAIQTQIDGKEGTLTNSAGLAAALSDETGTGLAVFQTSPTIITPTIASLTNMQHDHTDAANGGIVVTLAGALDYLTISGQAITRGAIDLATDTTGSLQITNLAGSSADLAGVITDETGSGVLVFGTTPTLTTPAFSGIATWPDGVRQTFNPGALAPGFSVGSHAGDPGSLSDGDIWYDSVENKFNFRENGATATLGVSGSHASTHIDGGSDAIDGDKLEITWTGHSNYTPSVSPAEADSTDDLTAHLAGIDTGIGAQEAELDNSAGLAAALSDETGTGLAVFQTSPTIITPTIASLTNAQHDHSDAANGGVIVDAAIPAGITRDVEWDTSAELIAAVTDESGTGALLFGTGPAITRPTTFDVEDNILRIQDDGDNTKEVAFQASGITTATTRTLTVGNYSGTIMVAADEGTSGQVLQSAGAGAIPVWANVRSVNEIWIDAGAIVPSTTTGAEAVTREFGTNDIDADTLKFDTTTIESAMFKLSIPDAWDAGTVKFKFYWTAASGSGGVAWGIAGGAVSNDDPIDAALGTRVDTTDTLILADDMHVTAASAAVTIGGTPAVEDVIFFEITRQTGDAADTLGVDAELLGVKMQYTEDNAAAAW